MPRFTPFAFALMGCISLSAHAQSIEPGLWEMNASNTLAGQKLPDMQAMMAQIPSEQRAMMEQMLGQQGVNFGQNGGIQVCITPQQIAQSDIPLNDPESGCQQKITERTAKRWKFSFSCPDANGQGEVRFVSNKEFISEVQGQFNHEGTAHQGTMSTRAQWVKADCGNVKPQS